MLQAAIGMGEGRGGAVFPGDAQRHGFEAWAVRLGMEHGTLCAAEAASSTASGGCASRGGERGCLVVSWVGGDCVCAWSVGAGRGWRSGARSAWLLARLAWFVRVVQDLATL